MDASHVNLLAFMEVFPALALTQLSSDCSGSFSSQSLTCGDLNTLLRLFQFHFPSYALVLKLQLNLLFFLFACVIRKGEAK